MKIRVVATDVGFYQRIRHPNEKPFEIPEELFSSQWMQRVSPAATGSAEAGPPAPETAETDPAGKAPKASGKSGRTAVGKGASGGTASGERSG